MISHGCVTGKHVGIVAIHRRDMHLWEDVISTISAKLRCNCTVLFAHKVDHCWLPGQPTENDV